MKICFVSHADDNLASKRMRVNKPVELLKLRGHDATFSDEADVTADVNVFQKHLSSSYDETMAVLLKGKTKIAFDVSDDHFDKGHGEHYKTMLKAADIVTCNGIPLIQRVKEFYNGPVNYIKDPITFPEYSPKNLNFKEPKLLWYGHVTNFPTMSVIEDTLKNPLTVITNKPVEGNFTYVPWGQGVVESMIKDFDIVLLPLKADPSKHTKNTNRAVDALMAGRFVVTDSPEVYGALKEFVFIGPISEGITWAKDHPKEAMQKVLNGQDFVKHMFNDTVIGDQWSLALTGDICRTKTEAA